jgi:hypothetical protein
MDICAALRAAKRTARPGIGVGKSNTVENMPDTAANIFCDRLFCSRHPIRLPCGLSSSCAAQEPKSTRAATLPIRSGDHQRF